jgi:DNA-directed RNA polymerase subunit RPC12/RpoP
MDLKQPLIACNKCKTKVQFNELKADRAGNKWICDACYGYEHPDNKKHERTYNEVPSKHDKRFKYQCVKCKYNFHRDKEFYGVCPYCGNPESVELVKDKNEKTL